MEETYTISLALFDFVPTIAFLVGAIYLARLLFVISTRANTALLTAGGIFVFIGGFTKAFWKLLVAAQIADIFWLSQLQFIFSGLGFLGMCIAVVNLVRGNKPGNGNALYAMAPWKIPFLILMTVSSLGLEGILAYISFRRGVRFAALGFVVGVMGILAMGGLASGEQTIAMQWIEETVNTIGQSGFMVGCILLHNDFAKKG